MPPVQEPVDAPGRAGAPVLRAIGVIVAVVGGVLALARVFAGMTPHTVDDAGAAAGEPPTGTANAATAVVDAASPASTAASARPFAEAELRAMLLEPGPIGASGASVDPSVAVRSLTLREYVAGYSAAIEPAACERARGLMFLSSQPRANAEAWDVASVFRADDLRLAGSTAPGSQQIRQFPTEADAADFLRQQRRWFDDCAQATYSTPSRSVVFDGAVDLDEVPDLLLASADDVDSVDGPHPEFDGWTRVGRVVYCAYLTGDGSTGRAGIQQAGEEVLRTAAARLQAAERRP